MPYPFKVVPNLVHITYLHACGRVESRSEVRHSVVSCEIIAIFRQEKAFYFFLSLTHASASWGLIPFICLGKGGWNIGWWTLIEMYK